MSLYCSDHEIDHDDVPLEWWRLNSHTFQNNNIDNTSTHYNALIQAERNHPISQSLAFIIMNSNSEFT